MQTLNFKSTIWALLLCAALCLTLSSCGGTSAPPQPQPNPEDSPNPDPGDSPDPDDSPDPNEDENPQTPGVEGCAGLAAQPNSYYLSPAGDDDAGGRSPATAWQSLAKLQSELAKMAPGDSVLFERGVVFEGKLELSLKGNPANPITFGSYCEGDAPVLSGFEPVLDWQASGNIWEANCEDCENLNLLSLDGELQGLARWPNLDAENEGYLSYDSFSGRDQFADAELAATDWTGAEAVVRTRPWVLDRLRVTSSQGGALELASKATYDFVEVAGYFMQNHPAALDKNGEWTYDADTGKLNLFLDSGEPAERVSIGGVDVLVSLADSEHLAFENLVFEGANSSLIQGEFCKDISFKNVTFRNSGGQGAELSDCQNVQIVDSALRNTFDSALMLPDCKDCLVQSSTFKTIAMVPGMGGSGNHRYLGVELGGPDSVFEYNRVEDVGYIPVTARSGTTVRYNEIDGFQSVKVDGGGIYTYSSSDIEIHNNIVVNGRGTNTASPWESTATNGIYIDQRSRNVNVYDNTFAFTSGSGIKLHSAQNITLENNTVFAASEAAIELIEYVEPGKLLDNTIKNNVFVTETSDDYLVSAPTPGGREYFDKLGTFSSNRYCAPFSNDVVFQPFKAQGANQMFVDFRTWQALHSQDLGSSLCSFKFSPYTVTRDMTENLVANGTFETSAASWFTDFASTRLESVGRTAQNDFGHRRRAG